MVPTCSVNIIDPQLVHSNEVNEEISMRSAAKYLWEGAIVPSLLSGAGTWVSITSKEEEMCEELQELFWRTVLQVPRGGPKVFVALIYPQNGDLTKLLKSARKKVPQSARLSAGGGCKS